MRTITTRTHAFIGLGFAALVGCSNSASTGFGDDVLDGSLDASAALDTGTVHDSAPGSSRDGAGSATPAGPDGAIYDARADVASEASAAPADAGAGPGDGGTSLIGRWTFDEGAGPTSADRSGRGRDATLVGAAAWTASGKRGGGLLLDGTTGYADVGPWIVDPSRSFTVACWVKLAVVSTWAAAISEDDVNGSSFGLKLRGDNGNPFDFDFETSDVMSPGFVVAQSRSVGAADTWTHLAGVYDASGGGAIRVYVNGVMEAQAPFAEVPLAPKGHFVIGRGLYNGVTGSFVNGVIDEVEVHAAALGDAEITAIYEATRDEADAEAPDAGSGAGIDAAAIDAGRDAQAD